MAASTHQQQNGQIIGLGGIGALENDTDTKLFVVKKTGDSQGITALISRQLQGTYLSLVLLINSIINIYNIYFHHFCITLNFVLLCFYIYFDILFILYIIIYIFL